MSKIRAAQVTRSDGPLEIVEREAPEPGAGAGKAMAAVVRIRQLEEQTKRRERFFTSVKEVWERNKVANQKLSRPRWKKQWKLRARVRCYKGKTADRARYLFPQPMPAVSGFRTLGRTHPIFRNIAKIVISMIGRFAK
jgi:hypothetical protein